MIDRNNREKLIKDENLKPTSTPNLFKTDGGSTVKVVGGSVIVNGLHKYTDRVDAHNSGRIK